MRISADAFVLALVCELRRRGQKYLSVRRDLLEPSAVAAFEVLERHPEFEARFIIRPDAIHGTSSTLREALGRHWYILGFPIFEHELRYSIGADEAEELLQGQEIPREVCEAMGEAFLERYHSDSPLEQTA